MGVITITQTCDLLVAHIIYVCNSAITKVYSNDKRHSMRLKYIPLITLFVLLPQCLSAQTASIKKKVTSISFGGRSTVNTFSDDGPGFGTGGQFRVPLGYRINTEWFADYIVTSPDYVRSTYYHIGWSVLFYPFDNLRFPTHRLQPYLIAGHCFDFNKKTILVDPSVSKRRWGSAVQGGVGMHVNITDKFDVSFSTQYMIHLTRELEAENLSGNPSIEESRRSTLEGHLLTTVSFNYKLFRL
jgi:hypothetical protein